MNPSQLLGTQRTELEEALRRESAIVRLLQEVAVAANEARTIEAAFQFALDRICEFTGWPLGHVYRVAPATGELISTSIWHTDDEEQFREFIKVTEATRFSPGTGWAGKVVATGKPEWIGNVSQNEAFIRRRQVDEIRVHTGFAFPVLIGSEVVALLEFFSPEEAEPDRHLLEVMSHIGAQLGRVVERVQAEESLRESERRLRRSEALLTEAERLARLGSWEWDIREDRLTWSPELHRIYGLQPGELDFEDFVKAVHPEDRHYAREVVGTAYATGQPFDFFHRIVRPDGEVRILHGRGKPELDESGELTRMVGTGQDVTELKQTEEELKQQARRLTALSELGRAITASLELEEVFRRVLSTLRSLLRAEGIFILLLDGEDFVFAAADAIGRGGLQGQRVPVAAGVAGEVIGTGGPIQVYGDEARRRVYRHIEETTGYRPAALLAVPLRLREEWIGVIEAVHSEEDAFDSRDLRLLEAAAAWTAIAIGNARLFEFQQEARRTAEIMHDAHKKLTRSLNLEDVFASLLEQLQELTGSDRAAIMVVESGSQLRVRAARGDESASRSRAFSVDSFPQLQQVLSSHESLLVTDARKEDEWQPLPGFPEQTRSVMYLPLQINGRIGFLCLLGKSSPGHFRRRHLLLANSLVGQASVALENAQLFTEVHRSRQRLRSLTRKVVSAQEEERRRVSRELHDEAGQALTALKMSLNMVELGLPQELQESRNELREAIRLVDRTMEQIRLLAHDLRPPILDAFKLSDALQELCCDFAERSGLTITYRGGDLPSVRDPLAISFYRFLQEALTNVVKYASANEVDVVLDVRDGEIELSVADDGLGFNPGEEASQRSGIGLVGAQERFELLGGRLLIESAPGQGTRLAACAPLEPYIKEGTEK